MEKLTIKVNEENQGKTYLFESHVRVVFCVSVVSQSFDVTEHT